jgi:four helix bundle protein
MVGVLDGARTPTMNNDPLPFQRLDVYKACKELARMVHQAQIRDGELRDQATRGAKSVFLGVCEGLPSDSSGIRRRHFEIANNSLHEVVGAIDLAEAIGALSSDVGQEILSLATRVKRMIRKLPR